MPIKRLAACLSAAMFALACLTPAVGAASRRAGRAPLTISANCAGVSVYPSPDTRTASPSTQISFRNISPAEVENGGITVVGSKTGLHAGHWVADSDNRGASFFPSRHFRGRETVTVHTPYSICGSPTGTFHFTIAHRPQPLTHAQGGSSGSASPGTQPTRTYVTMPGVPIPDVKVTLPARFGNRYVFEEPKGGTKLGGVEILNGSGQLVWFDQLPAEVSASDVKVTRYQGQPVLTWWKGMIVNGHGLGEDLIMNQSYQTVATVRAGNGYSADLHEFKLMPNGTAWLTAYNVIGWNLKSVGGPANGAAVDCIVQQIDVATGNVLFEWHSLDHVPVKRSYIGYSSSSAFDYFHLNSIDPLSTGTVLISARNTDGVYDLAQSTGKIVWTLGGKQSSFRMGKGTIFRLQHDAELHGKNLLSVFDDEDASPSYLPARGLILRLNYVKRSASLVAAFKHGHLIVSSQGNVQLLPQGRAFVGWGQIGVTSEYNRKGKLLFDMRYSGSAINSYRAYLFKWEGSPSTAPSLVVRKDRSGGVAVYMSWNGSTKTRKWEVLGGPSANGLQPLATVVSRGFQTRTRLQSAPAVVEVAAEDGQGNVLASSAAVSTG